MTQGDEWHRFHDNAGFLFIGPAEQRRTPHDRFVRGSARVLHMFLDVIDKGDPEQLL
jgi:hypothetical protein